MCTYIHVIASEWSFLTRVHPHVGAANVCVYAGKRVSPLACLPIYLPTYLPTYLTRNSACSFVLQSLNSRLVQPTSCFLLLPLCSLSTTPPTDILPTVLFLAVDHASSDTSRSCRNLSMLLSIAGWPKWRWWVGSFQGSLWISIRLTEREREREEGRV